MERVDLNQAGSELTALVEKAIAGEDVVITRDDKPLARVVPLEKPPPQTVGRRVPQNALEVIYIAPDFDAPEDWG